MGNQWQHTVNPLVRVVLSVEVPPDTGVAKLRIKLGFCDLALTVRMALWARRPSASLREAIGKATERVGDDLEELQTELEVKSCFGKNRCSDQ